MAEKQTSVTKVEEHECKQKIRQLTTRVDMMEKEVLLLTRSNELLSRELKTLLDMFGNRLSKKR